MRLHIPLLPTIVCGLSAACGAKSLDTEPTEAHAAAAQDSMTAEPSGSSSLLEPAATPASPTAAAAQMPTAVSPDAPAADEPLPGNCRWHGYGIGPSGQNQCDHQHLMVHAAVPCLSGNIGDSGVVMRNVPGVCQSGPQEVQARCCYDGAPPDRLDLSSTPGGNGGMLELTTEAPVSSATLRALANDACKTEGTQLGDYYVLYDGDTDQGSLITYDCSNQPATPTEIILGTFEEKATTGLLDAFPDFAARTDALIPPRGASEHAVHFMYGPDEPDALAPHFHGIFPESAGYLAFAFWARSGSAPLTLKVEHGQWDDSNLPWQNVTVKVTATWQRFEIRLADFAAATPTARPFEAERATDSTVIRFRPEGKDFDLWLDDLSYITGQ